MANTKRESMFKAFARTYEGLQGFTKVISLGTSVDAAEDVVILRKAEAIIVKRLYLMDPTSKYWSD